MALRTWNGGGGDDNWSTAANWGGTAPVAGDDLAFGGTIRLTPNNDIAADTSFNSITFNSGAGAFVIGGNRITLGSATGIINNDGDLQTINLNIIINTADTIVRRQNGPITLNGIISGTGGPKFTAGNQVSLTALNTYTGKSIFVQGTIEVNTIKSVSGGSSSLGAPVTAGNGTIEVQGFDPILKYIGTGNVSDRVFDFNAGAGKTLTIEQAGTGNLEFTTTPTGTASTKTLKLAGSTAGTGQFTGVLANVGGSAMTVQKDGTGTWKLSGNNTFTGGVTHNAGTLDPAHDNAFGTGSVAFASAAIIQGTTGAARTLPNAFVLTGTPIFKVPFTGGDDLILNGVVSGTGILKVTSDAAGRRLELQNANTYSGGTTLGETTNATRLIAGTATALGSGTLTIDQSGSNGLEVDTPLTIANAIVINSAKIFGIGKNNASAVTLSGIISGAGALQKQGTTSTWTLSGVNTYTGQTYITTGVLKAGVATQAFGIASAVEIANATSAILDITGFNNTIGSLTGGGATGGNVTLGAATLSVGSNNTSPVAYNGVISGTGGVTKVGSGIFLVSRANTFTGPINVNVGSFGTQGAGSTAGPAYTVASGATLMGDGNITGNVTFNNGAICSPEIPPGVDAYTLDGNVVFNSTSIWDFILALPNLGIPGTGNDGIDDVNNLTLDGIINVTNGGGFGFGTYVLVLYSGALTNNGLTVGTLPAGFSAVVTTTATEVLLVVSPTGVGDKQEFGQNRGQEVGQN